MSTILKALQKLEREKESSRPPGPTPVFSTPQATRGGVAGVWLNPWTRWTLVGIVVLGLSVAAIHFFLQARSPAPKRSNPRAALDKSGPVRGTSQTQPRSSTPLVEGRTDSPGGRNWKPADRPAAEPPPRLPQVGEGASGVSQTPRQTPLPAASTMRDYQLQEDARMPGAVDDQARDPIRQLPQPRVDGAHDTNRPAPLQDNAGAVTAPQKSEPRNTAAFENTPILTDGRLKVHAIAWSAKAEERMAVVNNRVIYEGDSMDTFLVVAIRPDDVVVREKDKGLWRVVFGRP